MASHVTSMANQTSTAIFDRDAAMEGMVLDAHRRLVAQPSAQMFINLSPSIFHHLFCSSPFDPD